MKNQALFSSKDKSKTLKCRLLQVLVGTLYSKGPGQKDVFSYVEVNVYRKNSKYWDMYV